MSYFCYLITLRLVLSEPITGRHELFETHATWNNKGRIGDGYRTLERGGGGCPGTDICRQICHHKSHLFRDLLNLLKY